MNAETKRLHALTEMVMEKISPDIRSSMTFDQTLAVKDAILDYFAGQRKHALDIRGTIPLFFKRFYFVLFMGEDRRTGNSKYDQCRRQESSAATNIVFISLTFLLFMGFVYVVYSSFSLIFEFV